MKSHLVIFLLFVSCVQLLFAEWTPDILGNGYQRLTIQQKDDYAGKVVTTIIRRQESCCTKRGILYVHGYNDYFFQTEMGKIFNDSCYEFYAVDLRKYGRSLLQGQTRFQVRDLREYFADIDSALAVMKRDGITDVVLMGHSTGGLITALYMSEKPSPMVKALLLNSPFLDWNFTGFMRNVAIPVFGSIGNVFPNMSIKQSDSPGYGKSLLKKYYGEWQFDTTLKLLHPAPISAGWVRAITAGQKKLQQRPGIRVPILLMHSDKSIIDTEDWTPEYQHGDAVLNINHIDKIGRQLGSNITVAVVPDGLHDLLLSRPAVRYAVYKTIFRFLDRQADLKCLRSAAD